MLQSTDVSKIQCALNAMTCCGTGLAIPYWGFEAVSSVWREFPSRVWTVSAYWLLLNFMGGLFEIIFLPGSSSSDGSEANGRHRCCLIQLYDIYIKVSLTLEYKRHVGMSAISPAPCGSPLWGLGQKVWMCVLLWKLGWHLMLCSTPSVIIKELCPWQTVCSEIGSK